ncbi:unnamed protein product [Candida parapsilosis]
MPISMTPVTEKESPVYAVKNDDSVEKITSSVKDDVVAAQVSASAIRPHQTAFWHKETQPSPSSSTALANGLGQHQQGVGTSSLKIQLPQILHLVSPRHQPLRSWLFLQFRLSKVTFSLILLPTRANL